MDSIYKEIYIFYMISCGGQWNYIGNIFIEKWITV